MRWRRGNKEKPREMQPPLTGWQPGMVSLAGRVDPLELIRLALDETGATGVGRVLLDYREGSADPRPGRP
jgi:hypothetical protein